MPDLGELDTSLQALADHGARSAHALPAADVRGRGSRRRQRRLGGMALAVAAAVAAGVVAAGAFLPGHGDQAQPAVTSTATTRALPPAVLPDGLQLAPYNGTTGWQAAATPAGEDRDDPTSVCQRSTLAALGAIDVRLRTYRTTAPLKSGEVDTQPLALRPTTRIAVAEFPDAATGRTAFAKVQDWVRTCPAHLAQTRRVQDPAKVITPYSSLDVAGGFGETYLVSYSGDPADPAFDNAAWIDGTAVGISPYGDRLVLVSQRSLGQDYDYLDPANAPISRVLSVALDLIGT